MRRAWDFVAFMLFDPSLWLLAVAFLLYLLAE